MIDNKPDIVEIISRYTSLRGSGSQLSGICPLHEDRSPSLSVNVERQVFKCHGCGEGGDVIRFIERLKGMSFLEACASLGMRKEDRQASQKREKPTQDEERLTEILKQWRYDINCAIQAKLRENFQQQGLASYHGDKEQLRRLLREWDILVGWHDSLWTVDGLAEMWASSEAIERIVL